MRKTDAYSEAGREKGEREREREKKKEEKREKERECSSCGYFWIMHLFTISVVQLSAQRND